MAFPISTAPAGIVNPAKAAGLRLGDRVIRIGQIGTENNDAVKEALEAAREAPQRSSMSAAGNSAAPL